MTIAASILVMVMQAAQPAPFQTVAREMMSHVDMPRQAAARTPEEWSALWKLHAGGAALKVDFSTRTVVAVFLGTRMSSGFSVEFVGTEQRDGVLTVRWREVRPDRDMIAAQVLTSPMHAATIPRFTGEIRFEKVKK